MVASSKLELAIAGETPLHGLLLAGKKKKTFPANERVVLALAQSDGLGWSDAVNGDAVNGSWKRKSPTKKRGGMRAHICVYVSSFGIPSTTRPSKNKTALFDRRGRRDGHRGTRSGEALGPPDDLLPPPPAGPGMVPSARLRKGERRRNTYVSPA